MLCCFNDAIMIEFGFFFFLQKKLDPKELHELLEMNPFKRSYQPKRLDPRP